MVQRTSSASALALLLAASCADGGSAPAGKVVAADTATADAGANDTSDPGDALPPPAPGDPLVAEAILIDTTAVIRDMATLPGVVFACTDEGVDAWDADLKAKLASIDVESGCRRVTASDDRALVATGEGGVIELAVEPSGSIARVKARRYEPEGSGPWVLSAIRVGDAIFGAAGPNGLVRIDLDAHTATALGAGSDSRDLVADAGTVFVADGAAGLLVAPISGSALGEAAVAPLEPPPYTDVAADAWRVALVDGVVAVASPLGVHLYTRKGASLPVAKGVIESGGVPLALATPGKGLLGIASWEAVRLFDVGDPGAPVLIGSEQTHNGAAGTLPISHRTAVAAADRLLWAAGSEGAVRLLVRPEEKAPDIHLPTPVVSYAGVPVGDEASGGFLIANEGSEPLLISSIGIDDPAFEVIVDPDYAGPVEDFEPEPLMAIAPNDVGFVDIAFRATKATPVEAVLTIESNDPDEATLKARAVGNFARLAPGDEAPDVVLPALDGKLHALSELRGQVVYFKLFNGT